MFSSISSFEASNSETTTMLPKRLALTLLERLEICKKTLEPRNARKTLAEFGKFFPDKQVGNMRIKTLAPLGKFIGDHKLVQGIPLPASTLSDILKEKDKWLALDITTSGNTKKKTVQYCSQS